VLDSSLLLPDADASKDVSDCTLIGRIKEGKGSWSQSIGKIIIVLKKWRRLLLLDPVA
jgi:hypothetical protein